MKRGVGLRIVKDIHAVRSVEVVNLLDRMYEAGGFMAKSLSEVARIVVAMSRDSRCTKFLSFPAAPVATGLRGVLVEMVNKGLVDVIVTTCGTLDHDVARTYAAYYHGDFQMDDRKLHREGYHRLGNLLLPLDNYGPLIERKVQPFLSRLYSGGGRSLSSRELCRELGEVLDSNDSLLCAASRKNVPVFVPGIMDGAVGSQLWLFAQQHRDFRIDVIQDQNDLSDLVYGSKRTGAVIIGGGISKHHVLWWNLFKGGLDYACYITTAAEYDGSLSGAQVREAISWGKVKESAKTATLYAEATAVLPLIVSYALTKLGR
ncbi:MAG: deoxyhypusine synthase [Thaumarchaeota archaeon]|nr:MAG: deoxyhypusine synthase [Nitrososphaerota archaeon]